MQPEGGSRNPTDQEQQRSTRPAIMPPVIQSHYELEFENPSSSWARKFFAYAESMSLEMRNTLGVAGNGKGAFHRCSNLLHTTRTAPLSSTQASSDALVTPHSLPSSSHFPSPCTYPARPIKTSPERETHTGREQVVLLRRVPEDGDAMEFQQTPMSSQNDTSQGDQEDVVAATGYTGGPPLTLDEDEEEEEQWILDEELARHGLYRGSYRQIVGLYSLTPAFTLLLFLLLAYLPTIAYPLASHPIPSAPYHYPPFLPFPIPEIFTASAFFALSHLLSPSIFSFFSSILTNYPILSFSLSSLFQSSVALVLREAVVPILLVPQTAISDHPTWRDVSFRRTWWIALGWAGAEAVLGVKQGYDGIALYRDVLVNARRVVLTPNHTQKQQPIPTSGYGSICHENHLRGQETPGRMIDSPVDVEQQPLLERRLSVSSAQSGTQLKDAIEEEVERDIDELIALRGREELEDLYGMPFIHIPAFISCLHRINSVLFILGSTLLLTAAYIRSSLSPIPPDATRGPSVSMFSRDWRKLHGDTQLLITLPLLVVIQWVLSLLHTARVLPRIGVQTFVYIGLLISLGSFFAGLGVWEGII